MSKQKSILNARNIWRICLLTCGLLAVPFVGLADPPPMPATFDRATVQSMVDAALIDGNAQTLKAGYFNVHTVPALPREDGYAIVSTALKAATKGTELWFCLDSLKSYAAFTLDEPATDDGFAAYNEIFDNAKLAKGPGSDGQLLSAIDEYVFDVVGPFGDLNLQSDPNTQRTLLNAWKTYSVYLGDHASSDPEPDWMSAMNDTQSLTLFETAIATESKTASLQRNFGYLLCAAKLLANSAPKTALNLLTLAKADLPPDVVSQDKYYDLLATTQIKLGLMQEAITTENERTAATGHGYEKLAWLYEMTKDWRGLSTVSDKALSLSINQDDITGVSHWLLELEPDPTDKNRSPDEASLGIQILETYLASPAPKDLEQQLYARFLLSTKYVGEGDLTRAAKAADIQIEESPDLPGKSLYYVRELASIRNEIVSRKLKLSKEENTN